MAVALTVLWVLGAYGAIGVVLGAAFVCFGVSKVDLAARGAGAPWHFRLLILPGAAALWPVVLAKWTRAGRRHREHAS